MIVMNNEIEMMENIRNQLVSDLSWMNKELSTYSTNKIKSMIDKHQEELRKVNLEISLLEEIEVQ